MNQIHNPLDPCLTVMGTMPRELLARMQSQFNTLKDVYRMGYCECVDGCLQNVMMLALEVAHEMECRCCLGVRETETNSHMLLVALSNAKVISGQNQAHHVASQGQNLCE